MLYKALIRPVLFNFTPEKAHHIAFLLMKLLFRLPGLSWCSAKLFEVKDARLEKNLFGIRFPNPVGLAAGLDKNAELIDGFAHLGFGFVEIGTVTPKPQPGNPKPRLFRLPADSALINRMGFNNDGADRIANRLKKVRTNVIVGGNIGKNKSTPNDEAYRDYEVCFETLYDHVDYFVVNVSSPNTPNLRELQEKEPLKKLLERIQIRNKNKKKPKPILLKIAPDLNDAQLDDVIEIAAAGTVDGIIAANTTVSRNGLKTQAAEIERIGGGGLSGRPLAKRATHVIRYIKQKSGGSFPVIGVGGIHSAEDALEKIEAGADLIQVYTGFIYEGPALVKKINKALLRSLRNH